MTLEGIQMHDQDYGTVRNLTQHSARLQISRLYFLRASPFTQEMSLRTHLEECPSRHTWTQPICHMQTLAPTQDIAYPSVQ